ncbi:MAG: hypothetical protein GEV03_23455 [Streptosporangiales bacterium]|nr:hypothetical protein [Streptosporangiales bacterium]
MSVRSNAPGSARLRVDIVGSFLRPAGLKRAFADHANGLIDDAALRREQDQAIRDLVAEEDRRGLPVVTDGEYRRSNFMESFRDVAGMAGWAARLRASLSAAASQENAGESKPATPTKPTPGANPMHRLGEPATERLRLIDNGPLGEYEFARGLARSQVKMSLINVDRLVSGFDVGDPASVYETAEEFVADIVAVQREIVEGLRASGCPYIQIDGPEYTAFVDPPSLAAMEERGEVPLERLERAIAADNAVIEGFTDITFGMHLCRGNRHSKWHREGFYDAIAERVFSGLAHGRLLLEYDDERSGDFRPLRFVPKDKTVVLGLITTKTSRLETKDELKRRIEEASAYLPAEQLALSPQCGFASDIVGNVITEDAQWRKLELMLETADEIWGS